MYILKTILSILLAVLIVFPVCLLVEKIFIYGKNEGLVQKDGGASDEIQDHS